MKPRTLFALLFVALWTAGSVWLGMQFFGTVRREGAIEVRVHGHDGRFNVVLPAFFAVQAIRHANWSCDGARVWSSHEAREWAPALRAALAELDAYDDVPLLEIEDHGSRVTMHKHDGRFVLRVEDGQEEVKVIMPVRTVRRALEGVDV